MYPKIYKGKPYGMNLTAVEQKALDIEIKRQLADYTRDHNLELEAMFLWFLHDQCGFGPIRLKRLYDSFAEYMDDLADQYELGRGEVQYACRTKLRNYGIDVEKWREEYEKKC